MLLPRQEDYGVRDKPKLLRSCPGKKKGRRGGAYLAANVSTCRQAATAGDGGAGDGGAGGGAGDGRARLDGGQEEPAVEARTDFFQILGDERPFIVRRGRGHELLPSGKSRSLAATAHAQPLLGAAFLCLPRLLLSVCSPHAT
jgi:hypothetical protein